MNVSCSSPHVANTDDVFSRQNDVVSEEDEAVSTSPNNRCNVWEDPEEDED